MHGFFIIIGIVMTAAVVLFGLQALSSANVTSDSAALVTFTDQLEGDLKVSAKGTQIEKKTYRVPPSVKRICFLDKRADPDELDPLLADILTSNAKGNIIIETEKTLETIHIENLQYSNYPYYYCEDLSVKNTIDIRSKGDLNGVTIYEPVTYRSCQTFDDDREPDHDPCILLDYRYWTGYKQICCEEFNLCC